MDKMKLSIVEQVNLHIPWSGDSDCKTFDLL